MALLDLTRTIYAGMPKIPILPDCEIHKVASIADGAPMNIGAMSIAFHCGTHIDAPIHIVPNGRTIEEMPLDVFTGWATIIPVRRQGRGANPDGGRRWRPGQASARRYCLLPDRVGYEVRERRVQRAPLPGRSRGPLAGGQLVRG